MSAKEPTSSPLTENPLATEELRRMHAYWRAANYLSVGQIYLMDNALLKEPLKIEHVKPRLLGHLGNDAGAQLHLRPSEPPDQEARPEHDLHCRPGARRAGIGGEYLSGRHLQRGLPEHPAKRRGHSAAVQTVFVSGRHSQPRRAGNARLDSRGRRTGLCRCPRLRCGVRQSRPDCGVCRRRRGSGNGSAGGQLAFQQIPEPRS